MTAEKSASYCIVNAFKFFMCTNHKFDVLENLLFGSLITFADDSYVNRHRSRDGVN
jgi:hypothetical protein